MRESARNEAEQRLRTSLQARAAELAGLWQSVNDDWGYEDGIYRFYHQSFKVYAIQESTLKIVETLQSLLPDRALNSWFLQIVDEGTGREFTPDANERWLDATRPVVEAFFHARFFLEMACRYATPPEGPTLPSGWAAFLYLFNLR